MTATLVGRGPSGESESKLFQGCSLPEARQQDMTLAFVPARGTRMNPQLAAVRLNLFRLPAYVAPWEGLPKSAAKPNR
jgi:hypothetical protein